MLNIMNGHNNVWVAKIYESSFDIFVLYFVG